MVLGPYVQPEHALALASIALSVATFATLMIRDHQIKKRDLTIEIWKIWSSAEYRGYRISAGKPFGKEHTSNGRESILYSEIESDPDCALAFGSLEHFFVEVGELHRVGALDRRLFRSLFAETLATWRDHFTRVHYDVQTTRAMLPQAFLALSRMTGKRLNPRVGSPKLAES